MRFFRTSISTIRNVEENIHGLGHWIENVQTLPRGETQHILNFQLKINWKIQFLNFDLNGCLPFSKHFYFHLNNITSNVRVWWLGGREGRCSGSFLDLPRWGTPLQNTHSFSSCCCFYKIGIFQKYYTRNQMFVISCKI